MPKYEISCYTTKTYKLILEAPSRAAAEAYFHTHDTSGFTSQGDEEWLLDNVTRLPEIDNPVAAIVVDAQGKELAL